MKNTLIFAGAVLGGVATLAVQTAPLALPKSAPSVNQILSLKRAGSPELSPDGRYVAYTVRGTNWDENAYETEIWLADTATGATRQLTNGKKSSQSPAWSPDGARIAFETSMASPHFYCVNRRIAAVPAGGGAPSVLTAAFDEDSSIVAWKPNGLFFSASQRTYASLFRLEVTSGAIARLAPSDTSVNTSFSLSSDGSKVAFLSADATSIADVDVAALSTTSAAAMASPKKLSDANSQTRSWSMGTLEVVSWTSQDGATIEGVLLETRPDVDVRIEAIRRRVPVRTDADLVLEPPVAEVAEMELGDLADDRGGDTSQHLG